MIYDEHNERFMKRYNEYFIEIMILNVFFKIPRTKNRISENKKNIKFMMKHIEEFMMIHIEGFLVNLNEGFFVNLNEGFMMNLNE